MPLIEHDHVVQALSANGSDQSLHVRIEVIPEDPIAIPQQIARCFVSGKCLDDPLSSPFGSRIRSHVEVKHPTAAMSQDQEDEEHLVSDGRDHKEVDGGEFSRVVLEEGPPGGGGRLASADHVSIDGGLR